MGTSSEGSQSPRETIRLSAEARLPLEKGASHVALKRKTGYGQRIINRIRVAIKSRFNVGVENLREMLGVKLRQVALRLKDKVSKFLIDKFGETLAGMSDGMIDDLIDLIIPTAIDCLIEGLSYGFPSL